MPAFPIRHRFARADVPVFSLTPLDVVKLLEGLPALVLTRSDRRPGETWWTLGPAPCGHGNALVVADLAHAQRLVTAVQLLTGRGLGATGIWRA